MFNPIQSIRNFFVDLFTPNDYPSVVWSNGQKYKCTDSLDHKLDWYYSMYSNHNSAYLTQAELQLLQSVLTRSIKVADQVRKEIKEEALLHEVGDDLRNVLFREHREVKAYLKKLAALQHRLKHKIAAIG